MHPANGNLQRKTRILEDPRQRAARAAKNQNQGNIISKRPANAITMDTVKPVTLSFATWSNILQLKRWLSLDMTLIFPL